MIIRVFIKNFLSFDEETILSLYPGKGTEQRHVIRSEKRDDIPALKAAVIYGANASGKSNFAKAIFFIKELIAHGKPLSETLYQPFKLNGESNNTSKIELEIKIGDAQYAYGIDFNKKEIIEEWLVKINKRTEKIIYERKNYKQKVEVEFSNVKFESAKKRQFAEFLGEGTPRNRPFLKEAIERNLYFIDEMNDVYNWFKNSLNVISPKSRIKGLEFNLKEDKSLSESFTKFLSYFKTGITELSRKKVNVDTDISDIPVQLINKIIDELEPGKRTIIGSENNRRNYAIERKESGEVEVFKLAARHVSEKGKDIYFELDEESDGTNRLIDLIPALIDLTTSETVYVIDELDRSMHPILTRKIMEFFLTNSKYLASQLIVTTHESNLLDLDLLQRDEIWFVEKNKKNSSELYSLLEYKPRKGLNISKGYLQGRFGAIPFLSNPEDLNW